MTPTEPLVLVVDDEPELREELAEALDDVGLPALAVPGSGAAIDALTSHRSILVVLTDLRMPEHDGFDLLDHLRLFCVGRFAVETVMLTGHGDAADAARAAAQWVTAFLRKPARLPELRRAIEAAAASAAVRRAAAIG